MAYFGFGINDKKYSAKSIQYRLWQDMVRRCYDPKVIGNPRYKAYENCFIHEDWKYSSVFGDWASEQKGFGIPTYQLDKDILLPNNSIYSEESCCFVPAELNIALTLRENARGDFPLGVYFLKKVKKTTSKRFLVKIRRNNLPIISKFFSCVDEASNFYKVEKQKYLIYLADKHKDNLEDRVIERIYNFTF